MPRGPPPDPEFVLRDAEESVTSLCFLSESRLVKSTYVGEISVWDVPLRRKLSSRAVGFAPFRSQACHRIGLTHLERLDEARVASVGKDGKVRVWEVEGWSESRCLDTGSVSFCNVSSVGSLLATAHSERNEVALFDVRSGEGPASVFPVPPTSGQVMCVKLQAERLLVGTEGGDLLSLTLEGREEWRRSGAHDAVLCVESAEASRVLFGGAFSSLVSLRVDPPASEAGAGAALSVEEIALPTLGVSSLCVRGDRRIFASSGWDGAVRVYQYKDCKPLAYLGFFRETANVVRFSEGGLLGAGGKDGRVAIWRLY